MSLTPITTTKDLQTFCLSAAKADFVTVDTEFLREKTYYPKLCLVQMALPGGPEVMVDTLVDDLDLGPMKELFQNTNVVKVFHAPRQDLEIFVELFDQVPTPLFDTQVAAMVLGYGDQIGYQALVQQICNVTLDKANQFTDWSRRPLRDDQLSYALSDVTYLRDIYGALLKELEDKGRTHWSAEEMAVLNDIETHRANPQEVWQRVKIRTDKSKALAVLRALAAWREEEAMRKDRPRNFILRDEVIADIALRTPKSHERLAETRGLPESYKKGGCGKEILRLIKETLETPSEGWPRKDKKRQVPPEKQGELELLRMLLRICAAEHQVVARLIAPSDDLEDFVLSNDRSNHKLTTGWRYDVFGQKALRLIDGELALTLRHGDITFFEV